MATTARYRFPHSQIWQRVMQGYPAGCSWQRRMLCVLLQMLDGASQLPHVEIYAKGEH